MEGEWKGLGHRGYGEAAVLPALAGSRLVPMPRCVQHMDWWHTGCILNTRRKRG